MRGRLIGLAGLSAVGAGAFIRSCNDGARDLASAICGVHSASSSEHVHCAGCAVMAAGVVLLATSLGMMATRRLRLVPMGGRR